MAVYLPSLISSSSSSRKDLAKYFSTLRSDGRCIGSLRNNDDIKRFNEEEHSRESMDIFFFDVGTEPKMSEYSTTPNEYKSTSNPWPG